MINIQQLDVLLAYHLNLIDTYAARHPFEDLLADAGDDLVLSLFGMTEESFIRRRWIAGFTNSCSTNLGRFLDKASKLLLSESFGLPQSVITKDLLIEIGGKQMVEQADAMIDGNEITKNHHLLKSVLDRLKTDKKGLGFEFRSRYGKNDDSLVQKDEHMSQALMQAGVVPVMAIYSSNNAVSAVKRLSRSWHVVQGRELLSLMRDLTNFDLEEYLKSRDGMLSQLKKKLAA